MAGGRPKGKRNKPGHSAGGKRSNAGRPSKKQREERAIKEHRDVRSERRRVVAKELADETRKRTDELAAAAVVEHEAKVRDRRREERRQASEFWESVIVAAAPRRSAQRDAVESPASRSAATIVETSGGADASRDANEDDDDDDDDDDERVSSKTAYMPPEGSVLYNSLKETKDRIARTKNDLDETSAWIPPPPPPPPPPTRLNEGDETTTTASSSANDDDDDHDAVSPDPWYLAQHWKFVWMPFAQFRRLLGSTTLSGIECAACDRTSCYKSKGLYWRPMFRNDHVVWVLHQRFVCRFCRKTFASIDQRFLARLPAPVRESFCFVAPSNGPGVHETVISLFARFSTTTTAAACSSDTATTTVVDADDEEERRERRIVFGPFVNLINRAHRLRYERTRESYKTACARRTTSTTSTESPSPSPPFSSFRDTGRFGGVVLTRRAMQRCVSAYLDDRPETARSYLGDSYDPLVSGLRAQASYAARRRRSDGGVRAEEEKESSTSSSTNRREDSPHHATIILCASPSSAVVDVTVVEPPRRDS